jgi:glycosyltransferase involved in cell wall biosynthesis
MAEQIALPQNRRVLFLNHSTHHGGAIKSLDHLVRDLNPQAWTADIVMPPGEVSPAFMKPAPARRHILQPTRWHGSANQPRGGGHRATGWWPVWRTRLLNIFDLILFTLFQGPVIIRKCRPDIIYTNSHIPHLVGAILGTFTRTPVAWHIRVFHGPVILFILRALAGFKRVRLIYCISQAVADQFVGHEEKVVVVHNGIHTEDFQREFIQAAFRTRYNISPQAFVVGIVGRIVPRKGLDVFLRAAATAVQQEHEQTPLYFALVGDTPSHYENYRPKCEQLAAELGIADRVIFTGHVDDVRPLLVDFDVCVLAAHKEAFGRSVLESMALEVPTVATRSGGVPEIIDDGVSGLLFEPCDSTELAALLLNLASDADFRQHLGNGGKRRVQEHFTSRRTSEIIQQELGNIFA